MIQVQLFRSGSFNHPNRKHEGIFKRNFKSVEELVRYLSQAFPQIYCFDLKEALTPEEYRIFLKKYKAYMCSDHQTELNGRGRHKFGRPKWVQNTRRY